MSEKEKTEELLKPRIKMIAPIPKIFAPESVSVGRIWVGAKENGTTMFNLTNAHRIDIKAIKKYPHLFKELAWFEEREKKDMPEYVWTISNRIAHVKKWVKEPLFIADLGTHAIKVELLQPATSEEYNNQKEEIKKQ